MTDYKLQASEREDNGRKTRANGSIPAVVYGNKTENTKIAVNKLEFNRLFREAGTSNLIELSIGDGKSFKTLVQDTQLDPVTLEVEHIDFFKVNMKEKIRAEVPLEFVGESRAVIDLEGTLITSKDSVEVECLPADLPSEIQVDISVLDDFEKDIRVADLKVASGVEILDDADDVITHVEPPRSDEEMEELESEVVEDVNAVEVENEKKEEETEESEEK